MTASLTVAGARSTAGGWPMTREAWHRLVAEIAELRADVSAAEVRGTEDGLIRLPVALAERRLETLLAVLERSVVVDGPDPQRAVIGRRVTLRDDQGETVRYALVFPGDGDPTLGWISADAPLGAAILGGAPGDVVTVDAPLGPWAATIEAVD